MSKIVDLTSDKKPPHTPLNKNCFVKWRDSKFWSAGSTIGAINLKFKEILFKTQPRLVMNLRLMQKSIDNNQ